MQTHINGTDMQMSTHWDREEDSPLARELILSITPPRSSSTLLTHVTHNQPPSPTHAHLNSRYLFPTHHIISLYTLSASLPHTHTDTQTWQVPYLTPGPRWSLVWRPVCVCLASNGPFKCRIFTADRAILGDSAHWGLNMLRLHYPGGSYPYYHHTTPHWLAMS